MYFYAISRRDLPVHQQAIQGAHAQVKYCHWFNTNEGPLDPDVNFVWITVEDRAELLHLYSMLKAHGVHVEEFFDPDYRGYNPSAIACLVPPEKRFLLSHLPLWKCEPAWGLFTFIRRLVSRFG